MISFKVGMCAAPIVLGEFTHWKPEAWILSGSMLGTSVVIDVHNHLLMPGTTH